MSKHIFISYSTKDGGDFALRLYDHLILEGHTVWQDRHSIPPGSSWDDEIDAALENSFALLVVLTPDAIASRQVKSEWNRAVELDIPIIPLIVITCKIPRLLATFQHIDFIISYQDGFARLQQAITLIPRQQEAASPLVVETDSGQARGAETAKAVQTSGQRPYDLVDHFKDRIKERNEIRALFGEPKCRIISVIGHGGMGKTAIASTVLANLERDWQLVEASGLSVGRIVYMSTRTDGITLEKLFLECAKLLDKETGKQIIRLWLSVAPLREKVQALLDKLSPDISIILLDNMEDLIDEHDRLLDEELKHFLEMVATYPSNVRVLITSRVSLTLSGKAAPFTRKLPLDTGLPLGDAVELLRELDPDDECSLRSAPQEMLEQAVRKVHGIPRALELMAFILADNPLMRLETLLNELEFYRQERVHLELVQDAYKRLGEKEQRVMQMLAVFGRPVPPQAVVETLEVFSEQDVMDIVRRLVRRHMISADRNTGTIALHPIDRDYIYSLLEENTK